MNNNKPRVRIDGPGIISVKSDDILASKKGRAQLTALDALSDKMRENTMIDFESHPIGTAIRITDLETKFNTLRRYWNEVIEQVETRENEIIELRAEIDKLREVCAIAYQAAGVVGAPIRLLDLLDDAMHGEIGKRCKPDEILPIFEQEFEIGTETKRLLIERNAAIQQCCAIKSEIRKRL